MDVRQCRHFVEVVDRGSYSRAAEAIPISQSALTRSIQNLEAGLGAKLLDRTTRGLTLTGKGEKFYARAKYILKEVELAKREALKGDDNEVKISVGIAPLYAGNLVPKALDQFQKDCPHIEVHIRSDLFPKLVSGVLNGDFDFCLTNLPFSALPDNLTVDPMLDVEIVYLASSQHPLAKKSNLTIEALSEYPWAVVDEQNANALYDFIFTQEGMIESPLKVKTNSLTLLGSLVTKPPFITILPLQMAEVDIQRGDVVRLKTEAPNLKRKGGLIYRKERPSNPVADALMDIFRNLSG
jgi:DNA-binding transcriptional LysR family regulator